jgi:HAD superfamily hydrolase (TIGR01549 family)
LKYFEIDNPNGTIYIRKESVSELAKINAVIFDCDGVLLDVRNAYNVAIAKTTRIIIEAFVGTIIPEEMFDSELNYLFKKTGGFNNDWSHAYAIIMRILAEIPDEDLANLNKLAEESLQFDLPKKRFDYISNNISVKISTDGLYEKLVAFASQLDSSGIKRVDELLLPKIGIEIKNALNFRGDVGKSIISTLFEELFSGAELFKDSFGIEPSFVSLKKGIVEADEIIILEETLKELENILDGPRFGIASGSLENTASHVLKDLKNCFPKQSQYWHDVVERDSKRLGKDNLHKPNPYSLLKASEPYNAERTLYVGDTMADFLTAKNAGKKFVFAGVYGRVHSSEDVKEGFLKESSPVVAPTVNEIPIVLRYARGWFP